MGGPGRAQAEAVVLCVEARGGGWRFEASSEPRRGILELARRVAGASCPVLIMGPTGVGKDVLAEDIHRNGARAAGRFVPVNCAALSPSLFESELFGHVRGAYTGAVAGKEGLAALADGGTLFLDEIGELPPEIQPKLLRFLATGAFWPVGGTEERAANVRILAATNRDLAAMRGRGFREDLYYRLSVVPLRIPPLAPDDVRRIARTLATEAAARHGAPISAGQLEELAELCAGRAFAGGARELRNLIERWIVLRDPGMPVAASWGLLQAMEGLPAPGAAQAPHGAGPPPIVQELLHRIDDLVFLSVAREACHVRDLASRLGLTAQAVYGRLRRLGLRPASVGRPEALEGALARAREGARPYLPWLCSTFIAA